jgi:hypothetical protein
MTSSKGVFIQLDKENLSPLGEIPCNANLNQLAQLISDKIKEISEKVAYDESVNDSLKLMIADLKTRVDTLSLNLANFDVQNAYVGLDMGCLTVPCSNTPLSLITVLQVLKNEICQIKTALQLSLTE